MSPRAPDPDTTARMNAIADGLAGAGLDARIHDTRGVLDVTASLGEPAAKPIEVIIDDDGYAQVSYWNPAGATPAQITATITALVATIISQDMSAA